MKNWALDTGRDLGRKRSYLREEPGGTSMPPSYGLRRLMRCQLRLRRRLSFRRFPDWRLFFSALGADQRQEIFGVKRVEASGLLSRGTQGDVNAPIVGQDHHFQIIQHFLPVGRTQVRILRYQLLYLGGSQLVLFAKRPRLKVVRGDP